MRPLLWLLTCVLIVLVLGSPVIYLAFARGIPSLESAAEVDAEMKRWAENERMREFAAATRGQIEKFEAAPLARQNRFYLAMLLADYGCPDYLAQPREPEFAFFRRVAAHAVFHTAGDPSAGRCDLGFSETLASNLGFTDGIRRGIAAFRIESALSKEQLLQYRVAAAFYAPGIIGAPAASKDLFRRDFAALNLAEATELYLAESDYNLVKFCKNAAQIQKGRDAYLETLGRTGSVSADQIRAARLAPLACLKTP
jgi:hypothetical protein